LKTEQEIRRNLDDVYETDTEQLRTNDYMQGYAAALEWVLEDVTGKNILPKQEK
jgi:hypothetical protein